MTQAQIENEYYLIDLPTLLVEKQRLIAEERLVRLISICAPNMEDEQRQQLFQRLREPLVSREDQEQDALDSDGLDALRRRLKGG